MPNIYLTFDDGPEGFSTPKILDTLKKAGVRATFFVCGKNLERYPEIARRIVNEGHAIGNHTYSHSFIKSFLGLFAGEIAKTGAIIKEITGKETKLFRPPWGRQRPWLGSYLKKNGYRVVLWNIDSKDWSGNSSQDIEKKVIKDLKENSVVLFHDNSKRAFYLRRAQTALALPLIIESLKARGYNFVCYNKRAMR